MAVKTEYVDTKRDRGVGRIERLGLTYMHIDTMFYIGNHWEPAVYHREIYLMTCGDLNGKKVQKRESICIFSGDSVYGLTHWQCVDWLCGSQQTGKFLKRWEYQTTLPASWEIYIQIKKQQLGLNMEQSVQFIHSVVSDALNHMKCSTPGLPVHHQAQESTQMHVHWVGDAIQPSHPLSSPSPPDLNLSQHQGLFKQVSSSHQVATVLEFQLHNQSFEWTPKTDLL